MIHQRSIRDSQIHLSGVVLMKQLLNHEEFEVQHQQILGNDLIRSGNCKTIQVKDFLVRILR